MLYQLSYARTRASTDYLVPDTIANYHKKVTPSGRGDEVLELAVGRAGRYVHTVVLKDNARIIGLVRY